MKGPKIERGHCLYKVLFKFQESFQTHNSEKFYVNFELKKLFEGFCSKRPFQIE